MSRATVVSGSIGAIAVLLLAAWWFRWHGNQETPPRIEPSVQPVSPRVDAPTLRSNLESPVEGVPAPTAAARVPAPAGAPKGTTAARAAELVAQIRKEVEPTSWRGPDAGKIAVQGESLVVRADPDVLKLVNEYLKDRRRSLGAANGTAEAIPANEDSAEREAARTELRAILRKLLDQGVLLHGVCEALKAGDRAHAANLLQKAMAAEPGSAGGKRIQQALDAQPPEDPCSFNSAPWRVPLAAWVEDWASKESADALAWNLARLGLSSVALRGAERAILLQRGTVTLERADWMLGAALARLSAEAQVDIQIDERVVDATEAMAIGRLDILDRPLSYALDQIVDRVPGHVWRLTPMRVLITRPDLPEMRTTEIFSVPDLLAGDATLDPTINLVGPDDTGRPPAESATGNPSREHGR